MLPEIWHFVQIHELQYIYGAQAIFYLDFI